MMQSRAWMTQRAMLLGEMLKMESYPGPAW
jgi:hypothetical protein